MLIKALYRKQYNLFNSSVNLILKRNLCIPDSVSNTNKYKYLLILDFEATCDNKKINQEIIEFPCLKINLQNLSEEGRFHQYVKPVYNPILTNYCIDLTGILQETVDESKTFPEVFEMFEEWRKQESLTIENSVYVTSGDWDLGHMLPHQCGLSQLEVPPHANLWIDIKKLFGCNHDVFHNNFIDIMRHYKLKFQGRQHSGIDDCLNIFEVVREMAKEGIEFKPTSRRYNSKTETFSEYIRPKKIKDFKPSLKFFSRRKLKKESQCDELSQNDNSNGSNEKIVV